MTRQTERRLGLAEAAPTKVDQTPASIALADPSDAAYWTEGGGGARLAQLSDSELEQLSKVLDEAVRDPDLPPDQYAQLINPAAAVRITLRRRRANARAAQATRALAEVVGR